MGKKIDLNLDPPPDLAIEVGLSSPSLLKFSIYAALGVPELWRYKNDEVHFYELTEGGYEEIENSRAFPFLYARTVTDFLLRGITNGQTNAKWAFAQWIRAHK